MAISPKKAAKLQKDPLYQKDKVEIIKVEKTYKGIAISCIVMLYFVCLFLGYVTYNYDIVLHPKVDVQILQEYNNIQKIIQATRRQRG